MKRNHERAVKEILADGRIVLMTRKQERAWRKKLKNKPASASGGGDTERS